MIPHQVHGDLVNTGVYYSQWLAFMANGLTKGHDIAVLIDAKKDWIYGKVGSGKTVLGLVTAKAINPHFNVKENVVIKDDLEKLEQVAYDKRKYTVKFVDEAHHFLSKYGTVALTAPSSRFANEFNSNRKDLGIWFLLTPWMGRLVPDISEEGRVTFRLRMDPDLESGTFNADLFVNNGHVDWNLDEYGRLVGRFERLPMCPDTLWNPYIAEYDAHDCRTRGLKCMANYRGSRSYREQRARGDFAG